MVFWQYGSGCLAGKLSSLLNVLASADLSVAELYLRAFYNFVYEGRAKMDEVKASNVAAILTSGVRYGGQLAAVFHDHALNAKEIPRGFEGAISILDATVAILEQVSSLVEEGGTRNPLVRKTPHTFICSHRRPPIL